ncbi:MAG: bifunctional 2-C-methyl-D-erythritol 4-phosphate cytidylyltransferase/2-C-methyl-D-erythritol 2,4-cyclodiphosphate synthase [Hyphomicrobium sp. 32-62-53]|nr:MAG: bifunctional 2-C-methyl-D-erythritol 4-phosphate cytidylyltransferase/2-C-methyl-D-erythritol 2,4-cyclodiphosphate synthase [Hyphomicrobium sp. 12-62-95]OYX99615.1 MAG: bifunctional 2-C-methyl-D-erythritol 4-phosphate cytidylyltransferase/2-C-methyl-D-erythritol 2,4-cyclodiphosphate synthase [Hyphomicrobium sp. 32-62-53]
MVRIAALIVAAGRGSRVGGDVPKQYVRLGGETILQMAIDVFAGHPAITTVQAVIHADDRSLYEESLSRRPAALRAPVTGGSSRQASVRAGLEALAGEMPDLVLIHDAARPFVDRGLIDRVVSALERHPGAIPALAVADTLKRAGVGQTIAETVDRAVLWRAQTPQGFRFGRILDAHRAAAVEGYIDFTDDAAIGEWAGFPVALVEGDARNVKITTAADVADAQAACEAAMTMEPRIGTGFDVHRFAEGSSVWLCGVEIPHTHKLEGHSDADVALHALTDALLGTIGDGDIGQHFPPSDPTWKGAASHLFLTDAARRVRARGGRIVNVDVTVLAEAPKIGPHRAAMQARVAEILGIAADRVGVKATTMEELGSIGRREGIVAMANALVLLPFSTVQDQS